MGGRAVILGRVVMVGLFEEVTFVVRSEYYEEVCHEAIEGNSPVYRDSLYGPKDRDKLSILRLRKSPMRWERRVGLI